MTEATIDLKTPDGVMTTRTFHPGPGKRHPAVLFIQDGLGVRDALYDMARRLASNGYYVVLPNLFYRSGEYAPFQPANAFRDPDERQRLMAIIKEVTPARSLADTTVLMDFVQGESAADADRVGAVGYCMGGGIALRAAGAFPGRVRAAASYHGGNLATDAVDSAHLLACQATGRLYVGYSENDHGFPDAQRDKLDAALTKSQVPHEIELYHAAHGFTMTDFPVYDEKAANRHWETLLALFTKTLS